MKENAFSTETNSRALYYLLGRVRDVMRKRVEGCREGGAVKRLVGMRYEMRQ